jgi:ribosomal protein S24E
MTWCGQPEEKKKYINPVSIRKCPTYNLVHSSSQTVKNRHLHLHIAAISKMSVSHKKREKRMGLSWAQCNNKVYNAERYNLVESLTR